MRISDWSSDVCSSDLAAAGGAGARRTDRCQPASRGAAHQAGAARSARSRLARARPVGVGKPRRALRHRRPQGGRPRLPREARPAVPGPMTAPLDPEAEARLRTWLADHVEDLPDGDIAAEVGTGGSYHR